MLEKDFVSRSMLKRHTTDQQTEESKKKNKYSNKLSKKSLFL